MRNIVPKLMMIQPGGFGDIIVCAPIAKKYSDTGYDVYWPVREVHMDLLERLPYVNSILLNDDNHVPKMASLSSGPDDSLKADVIKCLKIYEEEEFDFALNLADRGPHATAELSHEMPEQTKYRLSNIDFSEKHNLVWSRDIEKERSLYSELVGDDTEYILCGITSSDGKIELPITPDCKVVEMDRKEGYVIFDWYRIVKNAKTIYSVESSFHCFVDGIVNEISCLKYRLQRILPETYVRSSGNYLTVSKNWTDI